MLKHLLKHFSLPRASSNYPSTQMAVQGPRIGSGAGSLQDPGKFSKLAQRVEKTLNGKIHHEPKQLDPKQILVAPLNRDGAPPNVKHIHEQILKSFLKQGFDSTRPLVGICVCFTSQEGKRALIEHNRKFTEGCPLLPPIDEAAAMYGALAGSHLNLALRILQANSASCIGDLSSLVHGEGYLKDVVANGHRWWILPEGTSREAQLAVSLWRNQDQNENQSIHEIEILLTIQATAAEASKTSETLKMGDLVSRAGKRNPARISSTVLQTLAKYFSQFLEEGNVHLINELVDFHAFSVNPRDIYIYIYIYR